MSLPAAVTEDIQIKPCQKLEEHTDAVMGVIHLPGGQRIMTCSYDGSLGVWNLQTGKQIAKWQDGESGIRTISLSVDGKKVVSGSYDGVVTLWSIETGKVIAKWTGHTNIVTSVCWNGDGERVLSGSSDRTARVWDVETGDAVLEINSDGVYTAIFAPDSTFIATGGHSFEGEHIKIWDANAAKLVAILKGHEEGVCCLAWTADGRTLISGSFDGTIRTWNTSTWQQLAVFTGHTDVVWSIAISPNGCILASTSFDKTARLWNLENDQLIASPLKHTDKVNGVSFSTDGTLLTTVCLGKNVYTWDVSAVIKEAGLNELLDVKKSFLQVRNTFINPSHSTEPCVFQADATRRLVQQSKNVPTVPTGFFAESPLAQHPDSQPTIAYSISPPSPSVPHDSDAPPELEVQPRSPESIKSRFFKWFHSNTPARPTFLQRVRLPFFKQPRRHDEDGTEMQERVGSIVDVPLAQGLSRYANAEGVRRMKEEKKKNEEVDAEDEVEGNGNENKNENDEKEKQAGVVGNTKNGATTSRPHTHWSNIPQPVAGPSRAKRSSEPQAAATSPNAHTNATPPTAIASSTPHANAVILRPRCCIPFLSCLGCASQYPDGHH